MSFPKKTFTVVAFLFASALVAQPLVVGHLPAAPTFTSSLSLNVPATYVDIGHPASATGTVNRATVYWSKSCTNAVKVVFLRQNSPLSTFTIVGSRGPFNTVAGRNDFTLTPAVNVAKYDYVGVVQLQSDAACGSVQTQMLPRGQGAMLTTIADLGLSNTLGSLSNIAFSFSPSVMAFNADPLLISVVPAAGSVQGSGAFFRTSLQLHNSEAIPASGKLVFHKAGASGSDSDPSLAFTVAGFSTVSFADVGTSMGISGLGSLDVFTNNGAPLLIAARVFSDAGSAGTSGFTEEGLSPDEARTSFVNGLLMIPADTTNYRMNVGIRTLEAGATIGVQTLDANGASLAVRTIPYAPNWFEQPTANQLTGLAILPPGGSILFTVSSGAAFIYGTTTDNRSQDSSMQMAKQE